MKIRIYYRHTVTNNLVPKSRPEWFSHEKCFLNLISTIRCGLPTVPILLHVIFDGTVEALDADFVSHFAKSRSGDLQDNNFQFVVTRMVGGSQKAAWKNALEMASKDGKEIGAEDDLIYLLENDYLHRDGWVDRLIELNNSKIKWDYITLYDHLDKYFESVKHNDAKRHRSIKSRIVVAGKSHWRTTPSTCGSFILSQKTFERDFIVLNRGVRDRFLFPVLTKGLGRTLLSPVPGLATHCMEGLLSPCIDWEAISNSSKD